jgi:AcrR family transcriptional regulator
MPNRLSARELILQLAIDAIDTGGEAAVRVNDIAKEAGVTVPTLYRYFGSRDGLVVAAQTQRFRMTQNVDTGVFAAALAKVKTPEQFRKAILKELPLHFESDRFELRQVRLNALGSAANRPELKAAIAQAQYDGASGLAAALKPYQDRGWIRKDIDLLALAYFYMGQILGRALIEMGDDPVNVKKWNQISVEAIISVVLDGPVRKG